MKDPIDIQKLRKKRQRQARMRLIAALVILLFIALTIVYLNDKFVKTDITSLITETVESSGGEGFPVDTPSGSIRDIDSVKNNLALLKDSNLYIYNSKGKQIVNVLRRNELTVMRTNYDRLIYYDIGGTNITLHTGVGEVFDLEMPSSIRAANVGKSGEIAVITSPPNFVSELTVYNKSKPEPLHNRTFHDKMISDVAVSPKGTQVSLVSFGTDGGVIDFNLMVYPIQSKDDPLIIPLADRLVTSIEFVDEDTITVLTDKDFLVINSKTGDLINSYLFLENTEIANFTYSDSNILVLSKIRDNNEYVLNLIDSNGKHISSLRLETKPLDFSFNATRIYILDHGKIKEYGYDLNLIEEYQAPNVQRIYCLENVVYMIYKSEIDTLVKTKEEVDE